MFRSPWFILQPDLKSSQVPENAGDTRLPAQRPSGCDSRFNTMIDGVGLEAAEPETSPGAVRCDQRSGDCLSALGRPRWKRSTGSTFTGRRWKPAGAPSNILPLFRRTCWSKGNAESRVVALHK